jgi:ribonuclease G
MKGSVVALGTLCGRRVAARMVDGQLDDLLFDAPEDTQNDVPPGIGAIFRGIAQRPMKGQGGLTVRLPEGNGWLRGTKGIAPGQALLVQVSGQAEAGKAVPVTTRVLFKSRFAIVTPDAPGLNISRAIRDEARRASLNDLAKAAMLGCNFGLIVRSNAEQADPDEVAADITEMRTLATAVLADASGATAELLVDAPDAHTQAWRDWSAPDILDDGPTALEDHGVLDAIERLRAPHLPLPSGASAFIEPTRALVAVDVNTGPDSSLAAGLKANIALARALPRALRCRGLGGQITLDLAPMPKRDRAVFEQSLRAALRADPVETALAGWTPLGHYELQRKRERQPLSELAKDL